jgi:hypothetical protein
MTAPGRLRPLLAMQIVRTCHDGRHHQPNAAIRQRKFDGFAKVFEILKWQPRMLARSRKPLRLSYRTSP